VYCMLKFAGFLVTSISFDVHVKSHLSFLITKLTYLRFDNTVSQPVRLLQYLIHIAENKYRQKCTENRFAKSFARQLFYSFFHVIPLKVQSTHTLHKIWPPFLHLIRFKCWFKKTILNFKHIDIEFRVFFKYYYVTQEI